MSADIRSNTNTINANLAVTAAPSPQTQSETSSKVTNSNFSNIEETPTLPIALANLVHNNERDSNHSYKNNSKKEKEINAVWLKYCNNIQLPA